MQNKVCRRGILQSFLKMITARREDFEDPNVPFSYVELCSEHGAGEPAEEEFW